MNRRAFVLAVTATLTACGQATSNPDARQASVADFKPSPGAPLSAGDEIEIKFFYTPELNELQTIRPDGMISMSLIQDVQAAGLSVPQLRQALMRAYSTQLRQPELTVIVRNQPSARIYVSGEVNTQGTQQIISGTTVTRAIIAAQGMKNTAYTSQVLVIRSNPDGHRDVRVVDMGKLLRGENHDQDIELQPYDIVHVPRSPIADVDIFVDQYLRQVLPIQPGVGLSVPF